MFILTVVVVDDILALVIIATVYTEHVKASALLAALGVFGVVLVMRALRVRQGFVYAVLGAATWVALLESGVEPVVVGLAMGLLAYAYPAARSDLEERPVLISSAPVIAFGSSASSRRRNWSASRATS